MRKKLIPRDQVAHPLEKDVIESWQRKVLFNFMGKPSALFSVRARA